MDMKTKLQQHTPSAAAARTVTAAIAATAAAECLAAARLALACLFAACLFTACTADNDAHPGADPTGTPLILTAGVCAPPAAATTRSATAAGQWTDGDVVAVEVDGVVKRYLASSSAGNVATLRPADADNTHYWPGKTASVRAWYYGNEDAYSWHQVPDSWLVAATQSEMPGLDGYQWSDFLYAPVQTVAYDPQQGAASTGLTFYHQTARVVVRIRKAGAVDDANKGNIYVNLGYTPGSSDYEMRLTATFSATAIDPAAGQYSGLTADETEPLNAVAMKPVADAAVPDGYARCYEALVIPQDMSGKHFIHVFTFQGRNNYYYIPAAGEADLQGGYTYTYDITVSEHGTLHVTAAPPIAGWEDRGEGGSGTAVEEPTRIDLNAPPTINDDGTYLLTGKADGVTLNITGGSPTVIVKDLDLSNSGIHITGGTPVIRVEGTGNSIGCIDNPPIWLDGDDANVHVTGMGVTESRLDLYTGMSNPDAAIGTKGMPYGSKENYQCGNIEISNLTLYANATTANLAGWGAAAIGTGGGEGNRKCGTIIITDAHVKAFPAAGAASIGFGCAESDTDMTGTTYEMGTINIRNSTIESRIGKGRNGIYPAHIGSGAVPAENYTVGNIDIYTDKSGTDFFSTFTGGTKADGEVVVGFPGGMNQYWYTHWWGNPIPFAEITWGNMPHL